MSHATTLTIGAGKHADELQQCLANVRDKLAEQGVSLADETFSRGTFTFHTYTIDESQTTGANIPLAFAESVGDFVTSVWEPHELRQILMTDFEYYDADEIDYLTESSVRILAGLKGADGRSLRRGHIVEQVCEQLSAGSEVLVDGLLRFRMQSLQEDWHRVVEQAVDEYLLDLEQREFVKLLRYFVDAQEPQMPVLHLVCLEDSCTCLYDAQGQPLAIEDLAHIDVETIEESGLQLEDLLSVLIALAPRSLHLHVPVAEEPPFLETVRQVFEGRAELCYGCPICEEAVETAEIEEYAPLRLVQEPGAH
jgi:putative sporulation protein YtxC